VLSMTSLSESRVAWTGDGGLPSAKAMLNKVPEITIFFWVIKVLCTTVGETGADYLNETLGFGLTKTTLLASVVLVVALVLQFRVRR